MTLDEFKFGARAEMLPVVTAIALAGPSVLARPGHYERHPLFIEVGVVFARWEAIGLEEFGPNWIALVTGA